MTHKINRRELLQGAAVLAGGLCACSLTGCASHPKATVCITPALESDSVTLTDQAITIDLAKAPSLSVVGSAAFHSDPAKDLQIIVIRPRDREYRALSRLCTHAHQVLSYNHLRSVLQCNGFNHSIFTLDGLPLKGPASDPLKTFPVTLKNNLLVISLNAA
jgi:nitrite reductase/ring-hydroxylating ferredoxin subunit